MLAGALAMALAAVGIAGESPQQAIPSRLATQTLLLDVARAGERLVAVGEWGHVVLSDDGGKTWRQARLVPTRMTLTEVAFADARQGWAVGHDAVVLHTGDGGETWQLQFSAAEDKATLLSVWLENADHAIAVGSFGMVIETRDGGRHWERQPPLELDEEQPHLNHLFAGPESSLFIAAEFGSVFRSRDGGRTWQHLQLPYEGSLWGGLSLDGAILVLGMRGHVFRSEDLGESWTAVESGTDQSLQAAAQLADGTVVMVGLGGVVATSTDSGRRFTAAIEADRRGIAAAAEGANGVLLLFGETGIKERVRDGAGPRTSPPN
jgi:photosystem II stability/assembly factor-like uncharacterized protein